MIFDQLSNLERYRGASENINFVIDYLRTADLTKLPTGRTALNGDAVYVIRSSYTTGPETAPRRLESHYKYLDMHVVVSGCEAMAIAPISTLREDEVRADEDTVLYEGASAFQFPLQAGEFAIVYLSEGHLPCVMHGAPCDVNKLVFKIAV